jgi:hypothetical protein
MVALGLAAAPRRADAGVTRTIGRVLPKGARQRLTRFRLASLETELATLRVRANLHGGDGPLLLTASSARTPHEISARKLTALAKRMEDVVRDLDELYKPTRTRMEMPVPLPREVDLALTRIASSPLALRIEGTRTLEYYMEEGQRVFYGQSDNVHAQTKAQRRYVQAATRLAAFAEFAKIGNDGASERRAFPEVKEQAPQLKDETLLWSRYGEWKDADPPAYFGPFGPF